MTPERVRWGGDKPRGKKKTHRIEKKKKTPEIGGGWS